MLFLSRINHVNARFTGMWRPRKELRNKEQSVIKVETNPFAVMLGADRHRGQPIGKTNA